MTPERLAEIEARINEPILCPVSGRVELKVARSLRHCASDLLAYVHFLEGMISDLQQEFIAYREG